MMQHDTLITAFVLPSRLTSVVHIASLGWKFPPGWCLKLTFFCVEVFWVMMKQQFPLVLSQSLLYVYFKFRLHKRIIFCQWFILSQRPCTWLLSGRKQMAVLTCTHTKVPCLLLLCTESPKSCHLLTTHNIAHIWGSGYHAHCLWLGSGSLDQQSLSAAYSEVLEGLSSIGKCDLDVLLTSELFL